MVTTLFEEGTLREKARGARAHDVVISPSSFSFRRGDFDRWRSAGWSFVVGGEAAGEADSAGSPESRLARALAWY